MHLDQNAIEIVRTVAELAREKAALIAERDRLKDEVVFLRTLVPKPPEAK